MKFEMRWLVVEGPCNIPEKILQYRLDREITDYSIQNPRTGSFAKRNVLTDWITVPTENPFEKQHANL
jgi:hypothetical protein